MDAPPLHLRNACRLACRVLTIAAVLLALMGIAADADDFVLFKPIPPLAEGQANTDWQAVFEQHGGPTGEVRTQIIRALEAAERAPSMATAVGLLAHFNTFANVDYNDFRQAAIRKNPRLFLMADAAKYELVAQTNIRLHAGSKNGVAASVRVGSSGARYEALHRFELG